MERLLPTDYFHVVFTVPDDLLNGIILRNRALFFDLLFAAASETLLTLGRDPKRLGGQLGVTAVLHTWTRDLRFHAHLHCIVTGGGLSMEELDDSQLIMALLLDAAQAELDAEARAEAAFFSPRSQPATTRLRPRRRRRGAR